MTAGTFAVVEEYDFERTMALGERSMAYLKEFRTPAVPRHYELFYAYASGFNKELNEALREIIAQQQRITTSDAEKLYDTFLSPTGLGNKIEEVGENLSGEIGEVLGVIQNATNSTNAFGASLECVDGQLAQTSSPEQLKTVIQTLATATKQMSANSHELEERLDDSRKQIERLQQSLELVRAESYTDPLTGIANRQRFDRTLDDAIVDASEDGEPLCLLMIDIDYFKRFNDTYGHQAGDGVLRLVARTMTTSVKGRDLVARYGGEEFAVILPMTPLESAGIVATQIRESVMAKELVKKSTGESLGRIHLSVGIACYRRGENAESLIQRADTCLYAAKRRGRNQSVSEADLEGETDAGSITAA